MTTSLEPLLGLLPDLTASDQVSTADGTTVLMCAGFEDRSVAIIEHLRRDSVVLVLRYRPDDPRNRLGAIKTGLKRAGTRFNDDQLIEYDRYDPGDFPERLKDRLNAAKTSRVVLDISAMSKLAMLLCLDVCRELNLPVKLFYAEAEQYGPSLQQYRTARSGGNLHRPSVSLYTGVEGVVRVGRFSSVAMQGQPVAAISFASFNDQLIQALLNMVYPSRFFLINGVPPEHRWREEATAWIHEQIRREWPAEDNPENPDTRLPQRRTSTLFYKESLLLILDLYWKYSVDHRILLAPTGSKMQTVGCFFARSIQPDIHCEYPTPKGFLDLYSTGIGKKWWIDFSALGELVERLRSRFRGVWLGLSSSIEPSGDHSERRDRGQ